MTSVLFLGDTHGDLGFLDDALSIAASMKCDAVFQLGDFGFLWPGRDHMDIVQQMVEIRGVPLYWIDGNHDWHPEIRERYPVEDFDVFEDIGDRATVHHVRRGCVVEVGRFASRMRIAGLGGAPSIDRSQRTPGKSWWPEETITAQDVGVLAHLHSVDVLATHDAPHMPPGFGTTGKT